LPGGYFSSVWKVGGAPGGDVGGETGEGRRWERGEDEREREVFDWVGVFGDEGVWVDGERAEGVE